ncbi:MAG TPA: ATP synthase subunit I [Paenalcaligenes sp.]|nr:ATP synthase subunit I [Paenalcaligenes sp.]
MRDENIQETRVKLSAQQQAQLARRSQQGIVQVLGAQGVLALVAILVSYGVAGFTAALSAAIGAGAYFLPNALFALRLLAGLWRGAPANAATFLVGEAFKLGSALVLLGLAAWQYHVWLVWPALLFGLVAVLKGYVLLLAMGRLP